MRFSLAYRLALVTAVVFGVAHSIGIYSFVQAYLAYLDVAASIGSVENWSLFIVEFLLNVIWVVLSVVGFFGGVYGPAQYRRKCVFTFTFGSICTFLLYWVAVLAGILRFQGMLSFVPALLWLTWFGLLSVSLWPNYSLKRTAEGRSQ